MSNGLELWRHIGWLIGFLPIFMYAEIHYRLPFFKGFLYRKQPEIIFDAPHRIESDSLPVLLMIKDANWFPVKLLSVTVKIKSPISGKILSEKSCDEIIDISQKWFVKFYNLDVHSWKDERIFIECQATVQIRNRVITVKNDNYRTASHADFSIFIDSEPLPSPKDWIWGDLHCHSSWTEDQVEFGVPAEAIEPIASSMGISFCTLVEHSYDLDDLDGTWTKRDPNLPKWKISRETIRNLNIQYPNFRIIPGEEVSTDNGIGKNVHMVVLNDDQYYPGEGDALEKSLAKASELYYGKILESVPEKALVFAAHPYADPPFFHKLGLKRGSWNYWDSHRKLGGLQFMNGIMENEYERGKREWIRQLLRGRHSYVYAGNDSHGNFNRYRQIYMPMFCLNEKPTQKFGEHRTGLKAAATEDADSLTAKLKTGQVISTNGPFANISIQNENKREFYIGENVVKPQSISVQAISSRYFGNLRQIRLYLGDLDHRQEVLYRTISSLSSFSRKTVSIPVENLPTSGYFRAEVETNQNKIALTNPIWFTQHEIT
ncbi:MAG: hypothetical protein COT43_09090 [Candidatus Marinimicrobia bacterium CG08_land_8_20_14_0_20_45_22]|nr:MAG: hypothetical protein COT43_09090 [Candidatus Marinimicrobia bacterium CG08_land_8_20_14_0_20_45_22]